MGYADGQGRLAAGIGVSLLLHALLLLLLHFGVPGSGASGGAEPISVRLAPGLPPPAPLAEAAVPPPPPAPVVPEPSTPAPVSGMRLLPPRPPAPPPIVQAQAAPAPKAAKPKRARRVSSRAPRARFDEPPRLIAQDADPNAFLVAVPQPAQSEIETDDPLATQHGADQGMDNSQAEAQAEAEREREGEQQRLAEAQRLESERLAAQAAQEELERQTEQEQLARERSEQERQAREAQEQQSLADARRAQELAEAQRLADERQEQERLAQERAARERQAREQAEQEHLAQQRAAQERQAREQAEQKRLAQQRAAQERQAREQAEQERLAQQRAAQERQAREQAERERLARQGAAQPSDDPFGAGGAGGGAGPGGAGAGRIPRELSGPELKDRARELVKGLDLLKGAPPPVASGGKRRVTVGAAERDVPLRLYVDSWRMKIERTGGVHYPKSWASTGGADPLVNVAVRSDGTVEDVTIIRSSGRPDMDDKVRQIVRLNARYAQFPPNIAARYDVIDIRRIWRFDDALKLLEELP